MTFKPAHKEDRPEHAPGQIVNPPGHGFTDKTLADYIARKRRADAFDTVALEKKMTFEEWWKEVNKPVYGDKPFEYMVDAAEAAWKAAQENC